MACIDYRKSHDVVPQNRIIASLKMYKISGIIYITVSV